MPGRRGAGQQGERGDERGGGEGCKRTGFGVFETVTVTPASRLKMFMASTGTGRLSVQHFPPHVVLLQCTAPEGSAGSAIRSCFFRNSVESFIEYSANCIHNRVRLNGVHPSSEQNMRPLGGHMIRSPPQT